MFFHLPQLDYHVNVPLCFPEVGRYFSRRYCWHEVLLNCHFLNSKMILQQSDASVAITLSLVHIAIHLTFTRSEYELCGFFFSIDNKTRGVCQLPVFTLRVSYNSCTSSYQFASWSDHAHLSSITFSFCFVFLSGDELSLFRSSLWTS